MNPNKNSKPEGCIKPTQHQMERDAFRSIMDGIHTFVEIQSGPNPLTTDEIRKLVEKRPARWSKFAAQLKPFNGA